MRPLTRSVASFILCATVHCWNYRRAVAGLAGASPESEFALTTAKINENFSNYSAWHYRTVLIPRMYSAHWLAGGDAAEGQGPKEGKGKSKEERQRMYEEFIDAGQLGGASCGLCHAQHVAY